MTLLDLINTLPQWLRIVAWGLLLCWVFEIFLFPFKFNILNNRINKLLDQQEQVLKELQQKDTEIDRTNTLLSTVMALLLKREQKEQENGKSKDVK